MVQPLRTRGFFQGFRLRWISNWRLAIAFVVAILLTLASGYTTWAGMLSFTAPDEWSTIPVVLATFLTAGIQVAMLLSAWTVGVSIVRATAPNLGIGARARILGAATLWLVMFASTLCLSVFFSYDTFYKGIARYLSKQDPVVSRVLGETAASNDLAQGNRTLHINNLAETHVRRTVAASLIGIRNAAETRRQAFFEALTGREQLSEDARKMLTETAALTNAVLAWSEYRNQMGKVVTFVKESLGPIQPKTEEIATKEAERRTARKKAQEKRAAAEKARVKLEEQISDLTTKIDDLKKKVEGFQAVQRAEQKKMECEKEGRECPDGWVAERGEGPRFKAAMERRDSAKAREREEQDDLNVDMARLTGLEADREAQQKVINEADKILAQLGDAVTGTTVHDSTVARIRTREELKAEAGAMDGMLLATGHPEIFRETRPKSGTAKLQATSRFAGDEGAPSLDKLSQHCRRILDYLSNQAFADVRNRGSALSVAEEARNRKRDCAHEGLGLVQVQMARMNAGLREFDEEGCQRLGNKLRNANTTTLISRGEECLEMVALDGGQVDRFAETFAELRREHDASVHPFVQSLHGLRTYDDKLAYLSLGIAAMVDLLVFAVGIAGGAETLRRVDRIGSELRGEEILKLPLAAAKKQRVSDSEYIRLARQVLNRLTPQEFLPDAHNKPHVRYSGYIAESDLQRGVEEDDVLRSQIQIWMSISQAGIDLVYRVSGDDAAAERPDTGIAETWFDDADQPVRFYFLRELILDLAEDIVHWDKAHARAASEDTVAAPAGSTRRGRATRGGALSTSHATPFWAWERSRDYTNPNASPGTATAGNGSGTGPGAAGSEFTFRQPGTASGPAAGNSGQGSSGATDTKGTEGDASASAHGTRPEA